MKILIIGFTKIKYMPYLNLYLDNLDLNQNEVHLVYWNRNCKNDDSAVFTSVVLHEVSVYQEDDVPKLKKIISFIKYRKSVLKLMKKEEFDFIIVLHTLPGVLIFRQLCKKYKEKYILDYRDATYERHGAFKKLIHMLASNSYVTFVSSDAYRINLPNIEKIYTTHNFLLDSLNHRLKKGKKEIPIRISFWGLIRHEQINKQIIMKIAVDDRFELHFYGREQAIAFRLKEYCKNINAKNVFFHGEYAPNDRYEFSKTTDVIHNIYENDVQKLAMTNKYYDGIIFRIPQICNIGSYTGIMATNHKIGIECNPYDNNFTNQIYDYYLSVDQIKFETDCDISLQEILDEYKKSSSIIQNLR